MGPRAGRQDLRLGDRIDVEHMLQGKKERCAQAGGVNIHANVCVPARDRRRLERLCRYAGRPPVATERLSRLADGRLVYRLKRRYRDGTTHMVYEPLEFLSRLAALIPPPRAHQVRYSGCLAPAASLRARIVPSTSTPGPDPPAVCTVTGEAEAPMPPTPDGTAIAPGLPASEATASDTRPSRPRMRTNSTAAGPTHSPRKRRTYYSWAESLQRVLEIDAQVCSRCGDRMQILGVVETPDAIRAILSSLRLASRAPPDLPPTERDDLAYINTP